MAHAAGEASSQAAPCRLLSYPPGQRHCGAPWVPALLRRCRQTPSNEQDCGHRSRGTTTLSSSLQRATA